MRQLLKKYLLILMLFFFSGCGGNEHENSVITPINEDQVGMNLLVPLYAQPTDTQDEIGALWDAVANAAKKIPITVIFGVIRDPSTPVGTPNADYRDGLSKLRSSGATILAYVETSYGSRDPDAVKTDIKAYAENFDIDGIFFDEVNGELSYLLYYEEFINEAHAYPSVKDVMLNSPSLSVEFIDNSNADHFIVYENFYDHWADFNTSYYEGSDYEKLYAIIHTVPDSESMTALLADAASKNITHIYITDQEFAFLPTFWNNLVDTIASKYSKPITPASYLYLMDD